MTHTRRNFFGLAAGASALWAQSGSVGKLGLQIYSLRREAAKDLPATLAMIQRLGFQELEVGNLFGRTPAEFRKMLQDHGLKAVSMGAEWPQLEKSVEEASEKAHALGVQYVCTTNIPNRRPFTLDVVNRATDNFNRWGETLASAGLKYCYHPHGFEFGEGPDGTLF